MYLFLALVIVLGVWNTVAGSVLNLNGEYDYRTGCRCGSAASSCSSRSPS